MKTRRGERGEEEEERSGRSRGWKEETGGEAENRHEIVKVHIQRYTVHLLVSSDHCSHLG